jgi:hypothetical protein
MALSLLQTDVIDGHQTVKFAFVVFIGAQVGVVPRAKLSTHKGAVVDKFSVRRMPRHPPAHTDRENDSWADLAAPPRHVHMHRRIRERHRQTVLFLVLPAVQTSVSDLSVCACGRWDGMTQPFHVQFDIASVSELSETAVMNKVQAASGSRNWVR